MTCAPAFASASDAALPMPRDAPVMSATRPSSGFVMISSDVGEQRELTGLTALVQIRQRDWIGAGEAGITELRRRRVTLALPRRAVHSVHRHEREAVRTDEAAHLFHIHLVGDEIGRVRRIHAIEAGMRRRRTGNAEMDFGGAGIAYHLHDFFRSRAAYNGVIHKNDTLAREQCAIGIVLFADAEIADAVRRLDEGTADIMVADDTQIERQLRLFRKTDGGGEGGIRHRHDHVGRGRRLAREFHTGALAQVVDIAALDHGVRPREIDVFEHAETMRMLVERMQALDAIFGYDDHLTRLDIAHELGTDDVERTGLGCEDVD